MSFLTLAYHCPVKSLQGGVGFARGVFFLQQLSLLICCRGHFA
jgi:hypothetical protein